ncbi:MAG: Spy/CpxP family protein refolding chaperone [Syntrophales bacterium]|jgi:Spy/CpxP family protein refolding chaperone|nr:Spy/CpxP family protein refolding chaperone [Syntrophales bacterium]
MKKAKFNIHKVVTVVAVIALAAVVASPAMAYRGMAGGFGRGPGGYGMMDPARGLDLTAEQTAKINALREAHLKDIQPLQAQLYAKNGELRNLWLAKTPDQEKILALQKEGRNLRDQLTDKLTAYRLEARKILTPEQLAKAQSYGLGRGMARGGAGMRGGFAPGWGMR